MHPVEQSPAPHRPPLVVHGWWLVLDYLYAARRQLVLLAPPWNVLRSAPASWGVGSDERPEVILLPGVYEHWTFLRPLGNAMNDAGYRVRVVKGMGINRRAIAQTAEKLARDLAATAAPAAGRVLVAHSKGGLIGKHLLVASGAAARAAREAAAGGDPATAAASAPAGPSLAGLGVLGLVAVCTPFGGSSWARLFFVPSIRAFRPKNATIVALGRETSVNGRIVSIFGRYDPNIPGGSVLDGATNVQVPGVGHFRVLASPETHRAVIEGVEHLAPA